MSWKDSLQDSTRNPCFQGKHDANMHELNEIVGFIPLDFPEP